MEFKYAEEAFKKTTSFKRDKIIEVAISEFANKGYVNANINEIAAKANISIGSMYKYFQNKKMLYLTIVDYTIEELKVVLNEILNKEADILTTVKLIIKAIQTHTRKNINATKLYNGMTTESNSEFTGITVSEMEGVTAKLYAAYIKEEQENGSARKDIDPNYFAFFLDNLFLVLQFSYSSEYYKQRLKLYVADNVFENDELLAEQLLKFIKGALYLQD